MSFLVFCFVLFFVFVFFGWKEKVRQSNNFSLIITYNWTGIKLILQYTVSPFDDRGDSLFLPKPHKKS